MLGRRLPTKSLALATLVAAGCGGESAGPAVVALVDLADRARLTLAEPWSPPSGAEVLAVSDGVAALALPLGQAPHVEPAQDARILMWELPVEPCEDRRGTRFHPRIEGANVAPFDPAGDETVLRGFLVTGASLWIGIAPDEDWGPDARFVYPVHASSLVGSGLLDGIPIEQVVRGRRVESESSYEALVLPTGSRLELALEAPARAVTRLALSTTAGDVAVAGSDATGRRLFEIRDGESWSGAPGEVPARLEASGLPGGLAFVQRAVRARPRRPDDPPNVLFVLLDTLRFDRTDAAHFPTLARLADEGVSFEQCWSTCSWTLPSIATILTSNHGGQHGAWRNDRRLGQGLDTLAEVLRAEGYATGAVTGGIFVGREYGLDRGFLEFDARGGGLDAELPRARAFLERSQGSPWFLFLHSFEVHAPYEADAGVVAEILARHPGGFEGGGPEPHHYYRRAAEDPELRDRMAALLSELYDANVRSADRRLAAFLEELRADGLLDDTIVVVTSDHGEEFGEHGNFGHADTLYTEQVHVPLILRFPDGRRAGEVDPRPVSHLDLAPTILDACGLGERLRRTTFLGASLLGDATPSPVYASRANPGLTTLELARDGDRAWISGEYAFRRPAWPGGARAEIYDLARDPGMRVDLGAADRPGDAAFARWARRLGARYREPRSSDVEAPLDGEMRRLLEEFGYGGGGDEGADAGG